MESALKKNINAPGINLIKSLTGINGLDDITFGGIPTHRPTLLVGGIGTGKTFMSMQFIINGVQKFNEPGVFMTFEEKTEELLVNVSNLFPDINKLTEENKIYLEHLHVAHNELHEAGKYNIDGLFVRIESAINKVKAKRIVLDSLDTLFANLDIAMLRSEFKKLFFWLKEKKVTAIVTAEIGDIYVTRLGLEENVADCVIELSNRISNQIATRRLRILKYRGSFHSNNEYPFIIDNDGMKVFPIITQGIDQEISTERVSSGIETLDDLLGRKGFYVGSSILISGTAGTGKTSMTAFFAQNCCQQNQTCLFCAFEESPNQIVRNMKSIGLDLSVYVNSGKLNFYYARPTLLNLELHFMSIKDVIERTKPGVIILDPITNLMTEGTNSEVRSMLTRFIDYLKTKQVTVMFTAAITLGSIARNPSDEGISSMVDTWLMVEDIAIEGERSKIIYVMKSRGMNHSKEVREFLISADGVKLMPVNFKEKEMQVGSNRERLKKLTQNNDEKNLSKDSIKKDGAVK